MIQENTVIRQKFAFAAPANSVVSEQNLTQISEPFSLKQKFCNVKKVHHLVTTLPSHLLWYIVGFEYPCLFIMLPWDRQDSLEGTIPVFALHENPTGIVFTSFLQRLYL